VQLRGRKEDVSSELLEGLIRFVKARAMDMFAVELHDLSKTLLGS